MKKVKNRCLIRVSALIWLLLTAITASAQRGEFLRLVQTISLPNVKGRIDHMDSDIKGQRLFVAGLESGSLEVVDLKAGKWMQSIPGFKKPQGVAYVEALNRLVVASGDDGMLRVFRGDTLELVTAIHLDLGPNRVACDPHRNTVYVGYSGKDAGKDYGEVGVINAKRRTYRIGARAWPQACVPLPSSTQPSTKPASRWCWLPRIYKTQRQNPQGFAAR